MDRKKRRLSLGDIIRKMGDAGEAPRQQPPESPAATPSSGDTPGRPPRRVRVSPVPEELPEQPSHARPGAGPAAADVPPSAGDRPKPAPHHAPPPATPGEPAIPLPSHVPHSGEDEEEEEFDVFRYVAVLLRRRAVIVLVTLGFGVFSLLSYLAAEKFYRTNARLLFRPEEHVILPQRTYRYWKDHEKSFNTHLELLKSRVVLERVSENLGGAVEVGQIRSGLTIRQGETEGEKTDIIELSYKHPDAHLARDVVNDLCRTYIEYHREVNAQENTRLILNLKTQIDKLQADLEEKENALRNFKEKNRLIQLSEEANLVVTKLANMELALQQTQLDLLSNKEQLNALKAQIGKQDMNVVQSMTFENPFQNRLADLELELNTLSAEYSDDHFKVRTIRQQIEKLKEAMGSQIAKEAVSKTFVKNPIRENLLEQLVSLTVDISSLEAKRTAQEQIIEKLNAELLDLPSLQQQYAHLQRETSTRLSTLSLLKQKFEEAKIERDAKESDIKILELAKLPRVAVSSKKLSSVFMGILVGLILGIALAFLLEYLDQTLKDVSQVEKGLELPLLGVVPHIEAEKTSAEGVEKLSKTVLEPFRALRANLKHLAAMHHAKVLMICSAVKGEGKTTLAFNLALTFAMDGKKVILVDGDLRRSQIHHFLDVGKELGFYEYLKGDKSLTDIIKSTRHENLHVITSGERPHNPAELLGTTRFDHMLAEIRHMADIVIYDSPAILPVSDSIIMAPKMDACLMVVRTLWTPMRAAKQARSQLKRIGTKILGCILNGVPHSRGYYPYYYGYYGYYAYRYSYDEEPRRRPSVRELGLRVESAVKEGLENARHAAPRYLAAGGRFSWHILRRATFWVLLLVLLALIGLRLYLGGAKPDAGEQEYIDYLTDEAGGTAPVQPPIRVVERPAEPDNLRGTADFAEDEESAGGTSARQPEPSAPPEFAWKDSLAQWVAAVNGRDSARYADFYDQEKFRYPGGGFDAWRTETFTKWLRRPQHQGIISIDSAWAEKERDRYYRTFAKIGRAGGSGTSPELRTMIWRLDQNRWRIIREKARAL
ncbi:MAG: polysaccharide biosynthesis tyrosine autokinase [Chitinivibrionales bacterium]|nr:polysaccharide biosynthesis tyrosine autokinase [Chitinivibrionales bacterium]MBD3394468.1 polysaccharide biosynthesis tyrosine autokinase [Chitinivibrionales bacterium]